MPPSLNTTERQIISKVAWHLLPLMFVCYMAAFVDRVNVSFAKLSMLADTGLSTVTYATGAGIFFIGYFIFEVPSNLVLERVGARIWIARIMLVWGVISCSMLFVNGKWSYYALRFLLGAAEAGFYPGMILYNTYWFPSRYRARTIAAFQTAAVSSYLVGGPIAGFVMDHPQFGMRDWRWLFLVEGIPSVLLGIVVLLALPNRPRDAGWLAAEEKDWLTSVLDSERAAAERNGRLTLRQALTNPRVLLLSGIYFSNVVGGYGVDFFMPTMLQTAFPSVTKSQLGLISAIPPLITIPVMLLYSRWSSRVSWRRSTSLALWWLAAGLVLLSLPMPPLFVLAAATVCSAARWSFLGPFFVLPTAFLTGTAAAGGLALINATANLGGQAGPVILGALQSPDGSFGAGLRVVAGLLVVCGALCLKLRRPG